MDPQTVTEQPQQNIEQSQKQENEFDGAFVGKKKKKKVVTQQTQQEVPQQEETGNRIWEFSSSGGSSSGTREPQLYPYKEMLAKLYEQLRKEHPESAKEKKLVLPPPSLTREGKKTTYNNFEQVAMVLHRTPEHMMSFFQAEITCPCSIDGDHRLVLHGGRYQETQIESVVKNYIKEYVICGTCRGFESELEKEGGLLKITCMSSSCLSSRYAKPIRGCPVRQKN